MNRLQYETSPYLHQHAENPVDWYPWGEEALQRAREEDKPILLSIGYSACHWCHVMAHESFEDPATAEMMNRYFINIKVDREERPDLDDIYMKATQIYQNGQGGWPMTVFLTPAGRPFHAGTYYPPQPRYGMPSFGQVMQAVMEAFQGRREEVEKASLQVTQMLQSDVLQIPSEQFHFTEALLAQASAALISRADSIHGGLHTGAPKFPNPMNLDYLLRYAAHTGDKAVLHIASLTLEKMANGGIYDQLGGGFARYSVDERWLVPHFEKMLYDNAQLARVYLHAYQLTGSDFFRVICQDILAYVEREMLDASGGFYSAQDADSEGEEGKFYVWSASEFEAVLAGHFTGEQIQALKAYWDVSAGGNFEGHNILHVDEADETLTELLAQARPILFEHREKRIKPHRDEKILAAWNGMMLAAYAEAGRIFPDENYRQIAQNNADFILTALTMPDGRLYRSHKDGESKLNAYLEDYACVIDGLLELYQSDFDPRWFAKAQALSDYVLLHFKAEDGGGFFDTSDEHESLIARPRTFQDNAVPSGNNLMAYNLLRMGAYTGQPDYEEAALGVFRQTLAAVQQYPQAFGMSLTGLNLLIRRPIEVAIIGGLDESRSILAALQNPFRPQVISALAEGDQIEGAIPALLAHRSRRNDAPTIYVCQNFACAAPVNSAQEMEKLLAGI